MPYFRPHSILSKIRSVIQQAMLVIVARRKCAVPYALRKYFQEVPTRKGSSLMVSIAQNPSGIRT